MQEKLMIAVVVNIVYLIVCYILLKVRNSKNKNVREWDNGYDFYSSLSDANKEQYWKKDTNVVKIFLILLFLFIEGSLLLYVVQSSIFSSLVLFIIGIICSSIVAIVLSVKLQKSMKTNA
ncbi:MAG: hypothetical protein RR531_11820 [Longicatena sp.]